jgi:hypothetical protein
VTSCRVEGEHAIECPRIDQHGTLAELLTAHGMPASGDRKRSACLPGFRERRTELAEIARLDDRPDASFVQLRMDVVDRRAGLVCRALDDRRVRSLHGGLVHDCQAGSRTCSVKKD